jgi:two-component system nitrate/nitrite response regulator NarL
MRPILNTTRRPSDGPSPRRETNVEAIRTIIVQRNRLARESLGLALQAQAGVLVVRHAASAHELSPSDERLDGAIILLDLSDGGTGPDDAIHRIAERFPAARILAIGVAETESTVLACIEAGVAGYLSQDAALEDLVKHIRMVAAGETFCSPKVAGLLFSRVAESARERHRLLALSSGHLTRREREVVALIEEGLCNKEIAVRLNIETATVKNHIHNVLERLQLDNRRDAARYAREHGLLRGDVMAMVHVRRS